MEPWLIVAGTGHRPEHLPDGARLWARQHIGRVLLRLIDDHGTVTIRTGMARGFDTLWAWEAIRAGVEVEPHIPFRTQPVQPGWTDEDRVWYHRILDRSLPPVFYGTGYAHGLYDRRNIGMFTGVDAGVALWDAGRKTGGTAGTVRQFRDRVPMVMLDPAAQTVKWPSLVTYTQEVLL